MRLIQVTTDKNIVGITQTEETPPGVFVESCLVKPQNFTCLVAISNTTDNEINMSLPQVLIKKLISIAETNEDIINNVQEINNSISRRERIQSLLRTDHLNIEEKKNY